MSIAICTILAAGLGARMGEPKLLLDVRGRSLVDRAIAAAGDFPCIVVASAWLVPHLALFPAIAIVRNDDPGRGMARSLALADAAAPPGVPLAVLLADTPLVDADLVRCIVAARGDADVAYPIRDGVPGHPVVFGPRARAAIAGLPDGDTLRTLRADERWTRVEVPIDDERPFRDVDTPDDLRRVRELLEPLPTAENS